jgi:hypothetical protein
MISVLLLSGFVTMQERSKNIYFLLRKSLRNFHAIRNEDNFRPQTIHYEKQQLATRYDVTPAVDEHGTK